jgi:hypothetical protein
MKQTEQMKEIQERMKPGIITLDGFLGTDGRNLSDILEEQDAEVKRLGLTHALIAGRMRQLREVGKKGLGDTVEVDPHFEISVDIARGKLPCPFGHRGLVRKSIIRVRNTALGREVTFTDMNIHLIEDHGFYQGNGSTFHLDIPALAETLEITPAGD